MKPKISIVLPAMLGYETVLAALDSWESQTCRGQTEILILCPDHLGPTAAQTGSLRPGQVIVPVGSATLHEARAIGIEHASGDYVMLAEDHCLPDRDWAQPSWIVSRKAGTASVPRFVPATGPAAGPKPRS